MSADYIIETNRLTKEFSGFTAVNAVDLRVRRGQIHALIGPNGAGKTTCFNLLTKFLSPTKGTIHFNGRDITGEKAAQVAKRGIVRSFQISAVFPDLSVLENIRVALQRKLGTEFFFWRSERSLASLDDQAMLLLQRVGLESRADRLASQLPYGLKRMLELATTLALDPELMLLDEPTAGVGHEDVDRIIELIKLIAASRTIIMVEHNMKVVAGISDTITVLARGAILAEGSYAQVSSNPAVVAAYMGSSAATLAGTRPDARSVR